MEGQFAGWAHSVSGGQTKAELSDTYNLGPQTVAKKSVTSLEVEDLAVAFGVDMAPIWWQWISEVLGMNPGRTHDMAVVITDIDGRQMARRVLRQARIKKVVFPIFDAAAKGPANFTVWITAESSQHERLGGQAGPPLSKARALRGNFRYELGGMPTSSVSRVASPVVSIHFAEDSVGASRTSTSTMPTVSVDNMMVTLPITDAKEYSDWADDVIKGGVSQENKLQSSLSLFAPDMKEILMTIHFDQVGLVGISFGKYEANAEKIATMQVELNVERVRVEIAR